MSELFVPSVGFVWLTYKSRQKSEKMLSAISECNLRERERDIKKKEGQRKRGKKRRKTEDQDWSLSRVALRHPIMFHHFFFFFI